MANYSYQSSPYASDGGANGVFQQADANQDGRLDASDFRNFVEQSFSGDAGPGSGSSFESSPYGGGASFGAASSSFESLSGAGYDASFASAGGGSADDNAGTSIESLSSGQVQQYPTDAQGIFQDPNPQIIRRPAVGGVQTYTQNVRVRFLQPPRVPPPGPLIIKEVRPPQPPPPPPLRVRQQAPPLPQPPSLVLREKPPQPPPTIASQTIIRRLALLPTPPRSVIIERFPPLPPRPRDIIIERWIPYGAQAKRRTIVQRAGPAPQYPRPRNVIIQYEPAQVRVVRQIQRLGVTPFNPQAYIQQYGAQLLDTNTLLQKARAAGIIEDISPPSSGVAVDLGAGSYGQESVFGVPSSFDSSTGLITGGGGDAGFSGEFGSPSYELSSFSSGGTGSYEGSFASGGGFAGSSFESSGVSSGFGGGVNTPFAAADINRDSSLNQNEFHNYISGDSYGTSSYESFNQSSAT